MRLGRVTALTDKGRRRISNEDAYVCDPPLFAVADGMGGAQAGEVASGLAARALEDGARGLHGEEAVAELIREANHRIYDRSLADPAMAGMGTTFTVAVVDATSGTLAIGHVGDSRAYRLRGEHLEQLTADHSVVAELLRSGRLTPEDAERHPLRSAITRALGTEPVVDVDTLTVELALGDLYLLCSDGLTTMVGDEEILAIADADQRDPARVAEGLVVAANRAGGEGNVTVVVFETVDGGPGDPVAEDPVAAEPVSAEPVAEAVDETTLESAVPTGADVHGADVRRHGAGKGGRALALAVIVVGLAVAALLIFWGLTQ